VRNELGGLYYSLSKDTDIDGSRWPWFERHLFSIGNHQATLALSERFGEPGRQLHKEFQILSEERRWSLL